MIKDAAPKHPDSEKWYWIEWDQTELNGATIVTSNWTLPDGINKDDEAVSGLLVGIKLSGGTLNTDYDIGNEIITNYPEKLHETIRIRIRNVGH